MIKAENVFDESRGEGECGRKNIRRFVTASLINLPELLTSPGHRWKMSLFSISGNSTEYTEGNLSILTIGNSSHLAKLSPTENAHFHQE